MQRSNRAQACNTTQLVYQSVSWSGAGEYQAGNLPLVLSILVNGESGILALSSSSSSCSDFGKPSGIGHSLSLSFITFGGAAILKAFFFPVFIDEIPCKHPINDLTPPDWIISLTTSSFGDSLCSASQLVKTLLNGSQVLDTYWIFSHF
jgi:hypothetical protein